MDLKFKTLTFKIGGLCETNRVENHKSISIYNIYWWLGGQEAFSWLLAPRLMNILTLSGYS